MWLLDVLICFLILMFGINFKKKFKGLNLRDKKILDYLFYFHTLVGVIFYFYIIGRGDAVYYWMRTKELTLNVLWYNLLNQGHASDFIYFFNYLFSNTLDLSFFTGSILYTVLGYIGLVYFYLILKKIVPNYHYLRKLKILNISVFPFYLFFPNLHFWSCGVGKDTLLFLCVALFIYSLIELKKNIGNLSLSILLSVFVRPHMTIFLIAGFGIGYTLSSNITTYKKVIMSSVFVFAFFLLFDYALNFIQLESVDTSSIKEYADTKAKVLSSKSNSGVDISGYPYPLKILTYLYRPFFFDINNPIAVIASFENLFLLLLTLKIFKFKNIRHIKQASHIIKGSIVFLLIGTLTFSLILGNLGIMLREKNMFTPVFIIVAYWLLSVSKLNQKQN